MGSSGCVIGIEHIKELVDLSVKNIKNDAPSLLAEDRIRLLGRLVLGRLVFGGLVHW